MFTQGTYWLGLALLCGLYWCLPVRRRAACLALGGAGLITWISPRSGVFTLAIGSAVALIVLKCGRIARWTSLVGLAALMLGAKFMAPAGLAESARQPGIWLPLGFSYLIFRLLHVVAEADRGAKMPGPAAFWAYVFFPPIFSAGPIQRMELFRDAWPERPDPADFAQGGTRIVIGLIKKFLLCDYLVAHLQSGLRLTPALLDGPALPARGVCWGIVTLTYLSIYFDMSAYADIALGAGRLFGFRLMENFRSPLLSTSPQDFWRRWHISLAQWCSSYVYMPLVGALRSPYLPLFTTFLVMGMWHALGWNRVGWAVWQAAGVLGHVAWRKFLDRRGRARWREERPWQGVSWLLTQGFVIGGYAFLAGGEHQTLGHSLRVLGHMFAPLS